ncbi:MAG: hypothetical protein DME25_08650 [Verrucomicrobia bacterium]|nr:MAG: hypothetical protein DME25_08650 [Verrucomicrobiota bacterium]
MIYSGKQIVSRIKIHFKKRGGAYEAWFVGICKNARSRLFNAHGVHKTGDCWIYAHAESPKVARSVKSYFVKKLGTAGEKGAMGQDPSSARPAEDFVYAYKKNEHTKP